MAYICRLVEGTEPAIDLQYNPAAGWSLLNRGIQIADPQIVELWGGQLQDQLVRRQEGKRIIPLRLVLQATDGIDLIDRVNALEERLRHAARYRIDGWGDEVFLELQVDDSTDTVQFPVCSGEIDKDRLYEICGGEKVNMIKDVPITLNCEAYWEDDSTFTLDNYVYNPAFWRGALPGDSWAEDDVPGALALAWNTTIWERMGRSLEWTIAPAGANDVGIQSDNITVVASTQYYVEYRGYHTAGCDDITARVWDATAGAVIPASIQVFNNQDDAWEKLGVAFTTPVACVLVRIEVYRLLGDSTAGNKTFYCDAFYLTLGGTAPTGWSSGRNLTNELDAADQINVLCVAEIPGEVDAEVSYNLDFTQTFQLIRVAKRTRPNSHNFIWELLGTNAVVTAGDAACIDSALVGDGNAPGGQRVEVSFVGNQTMQLRCYWDITGAVLADYFGKYQFMVMVDKSANTDVVRMEIETWDHGPYWGENSTHPQECPQVAAAEWRCLEGWGTFSFPIGNHDSFSAGNRWRIRLLAEVTGAAAWDVLRIAGLYLIPVDAGYAIAGLDGISFAANCNARWKQLDGERGLFVDNPATPASFASVTSIGNFPLLTPEVENWLYFSKDGSDLGADLTITDPVVASVEYRPRGIFLRGTNP